ncbi:DUF1707 SHOCT-like domain-containing protein [Miltoncostaea marina]|uniref:DUF1707 SHOCT-like domain-containing protein n=1 Tax=Miltoncostaea marina TaxID=2843215 RepID=UPI001C3DF6E0|nr:DUF1707 domain-containing protein [Miltoncostaea marina]
MGADETGLVRASDAERDRALEALGAATAEGRLTLEEHAERAAAALAATTRAELEALTADLPAAPAPPAGGRGRGRRWVLGILGGDDRRGRWRIGPRCTVVNVMGGADLDLRDAVVEGPETEIVVFSLMGGSTITVPEGADVDAGGFALLGGNDVRVEGPPPARGAPRIRVRAYSVMGGTDVRTPKERRRERPRLHGHSA